MADSEVSPENQSLNDLNDVDIYADVLCDQDSLIIKLKEKVQKVSKEKELLFRSLNSLQKNYEDLRKEYENLKEKFNVVSFNSSALFKTAQAEVKRKDKLINELRREKDDLVFRKVCVNQALQRSRRCAALSPRKYRSPIKKQNIILRNNLKEPTKTPTEESCGKLRHPNSKSTEGSSEELLVSKDTLETNNLEPLRPCAVEHLESYRTIQKSSEGISSFKETNIVLEEDSQVPVKLPDIQNDGSSKCKETKKLLPPLQGPVTAYSKRQYKKIHGVSPPKLEIKSVKKGGLPENTIPKLNYTNKESEITERDNKVESISSKLKKEVQQIIKLGSPSKNSSFTTKQSPEKQNQYNSPIKDEIAKQTPSKSVVEKLIIQCDLRNTDNHHNSANYVSLNETIGNILKKQRAGPYSTKLNTNVTAVCKDEELEKQNCCIDPVSKTACKILPNLNKKSTDKLKISPATFGNLVSHQLNSGVNVALSKKTDLGKDKSIERKCGLQKRKISESSESEVSPQSQKGKRKRIHKINSISSLFGESPIKCNNALIDKVKAGPTQNPTKVEKNSPVEEITYPSSPKFPDSPLIDSDNNESLIIDTTYCSQKTSPKVSESDKNNINENGGKAEVKNIGTNNEPELMQFPVAETKEPAEQQKEFTLPCTQDETYPSVSLIKNKEVQNILIATKTTNDPKEDLISFPQLATNNINNLSKEDTARQPLHNIDQNKLSTPNNSYQSADGNDNAQNLQVESLHLSESLDKVVCPEKTSESQNQHLSDDKDAVFQSTSDDKAGPRFIPSPPQLTMVSAFKHSENSVFALAEDTIGFVRILTRMRDLSPIRTPDKNNKSLNSSLSQHQQMDVTGLDHANTEVSTKTSFEFIKPLNQDPKNKNNSLSLVPVLNRKEDLHPKCSRVNTLPQSCEITQFKASEKQCALETNKCRTKQTETVQSFCNQPQNQNNVLEQKNKEEKSNTNKFLNDNGNISSKKTAQTPKHPFRRRNPVQRITSENMSDLKTSKQQNSEKEVCMQLNDIDKINRSPNTRTVHNITMNEANSVNENVYKNTADLIKKVKREVKLAGITTNSDSAKTTSSDLNNCPKKGLEPKSHNVDKVKIFKRSESLKMVRKPLPRNYINVMKNIEGKTSEDVFKNTSSTTKKDSEDFVSKKVEIYEKLDPSMDVTKISDPSIDVPKISEMDQVSHIANINQKLRVSKYQKSKNDNINQPNVSENVLIPNKEFNFLMNIKKSDLSTKNENDKLFKNEKEILSQTNRHSTSLNISSKERKRNCRRSVSLGPEIRLGIHINLPLNKKNETASASDLKCKNSHFSPSIQKISESISIKRSDAEKENPYRKCADKIEQSFNFKSGTYLDSRSKSTNSRSRNPENCHTESKSPDPIISACGLRKSRSRSPIPHKRSKSSHKVTPRKYPDFERRNCHKLPIRSLDHTLSKYGHEYCSERSYSGSKSRRSRYDKYHSRSPSPEQKRHQRRSSRYKYCYRNNRSKSKSPEQKNKNYVVKTRQEENLIKKSISYSLCSPDKSLENSSFSRQESDNNSKRNLSQNQSHDMKKKSNTKDDAGDVNKQAEKNAFLSYEEKFEKMRKEIEMLKRQVNSKHEGIVLNNTSKYDEKGSQMLQCQRGTKESTQLSLEKPKPIQVKRRKRTLGDSEVNVVSIK